MKFVVKKYAKIRTHIFIYFIIVCIMSAAMLSMASAEESGDYTLYKKNFKQMYEDNDTSYDVNCDWITYCTNLKYNDVSQDGKMQICEGGLCGGRDKETAAIYRWKLNSAASIKGENYGMNMKLSFWFHAKFNGKIPFSGAYFRYYYETDKKYVELVYQKEPGVSYVLYSAEANEVISATASIEYELVFDDEEAELKLKNRNTGKIFDSGKINLRECLANQGISEFNSRGQFALTADTEWGYLSMRNIEIVSYEPAATLNPTLYIQPDSLKISGDRIEITAVYDNLGISAPKIISAVYDGTGMLLGVGLAEGKQNLNSVPVSVEIQKNSSPARVKLFCVNSEDSLSPISTSPEYEIPK